MESLCSAISEPDPGQRFVELLRQLASVLIRHWDRLGIFAGDLHQHHVAGMPFDKGRIDFYWFRTAGHLPSDLVRPIFNRGRRSLIDTVSRILP